MISLQSDTSEAVLIRAIITSSKQKERSKRLIINKPRFVHTHTHIYIEREIDIKSTDRESHEKQITQRQKDDGLQDNTISVHIDMSFVGSKKKREITPDDAWNKTRVQLRLQKKKMTREGKAGACEKYMVMMKRDGEGRKKGAIGDGDKCFRSR
jgi:hypothetical protein